MFEKQILHAQDLIRRIYLCADRGLSEVPKSEWVSIAERKALESAIIELVNHSFGATSREMQRYWAVMDNLVTLRENALARGDPKWECTYLIEHYFQMNGLLQEFDAKFAASQFEKIREIVMGDKYVTGQAGSVGRGSHAHGITFNQIWNQVEASIPLDQLGTELAFLRNTMKNEATTREQDIAVGVVAAAEQAANSGDGPKSLEYLRSAGKWALDVAEKIGVGIAATAIKSSVGL